MWRAIVEAALRGELLDVGEGAAQPVVGIPERHGAQPGRVDQHSATRNQDRARARSWCAGRAGRRSRTSPVACTSVPTSAFTSVDFPTPDAPMSAIVRLSDASARTSSTPTPDTELVSTTSTPGAASSASCDRRVDDVGLVDFVGLRQHDNGRRAALVRQHELAFEPADVRAVRERLHDEHDVDVRGHDLRARVPVPSIGSPRTNADRRGNTATTRSSSMKHPVAGRDRHPRRAWRTTVPSAVSTVTRPDVDAPDATRAPGTPRSGAARRAASAQPSSHPSAAERVSLRSPASNQRTLAPCGPRSHCSRATCACTTTLSSRPRRAAPIDGRPAVRVRSRHARAHRAQPARIASGSCASASSISTRRLRDRGGAARRAPRRLGTRSAAARVRVDGARRIHVARDVERATRSDGSRGCGRPRRRRRRGRRARQRSRWFRPTRSGSRTSCSRRTTSVGSPSRGANVAPVPRAITRAPTAIGSDARSPIGAPPGDWVGGETAARAQLKAWTPRGSRRVRRRCATIPAPTRPRGCRRTSTSVASLRSKSRSRLWDRDGAAPFRAPALLARLLPQLLWWRPETAHADVRAAARRSGSTIPRRLAAWKEGRTGFPLVDAGMRQLRAEGWMHNRVRMVVGVVSHARILRIDWRTGAAYFMDLLVDGDVANNQLNWQWVAGTGTDTNPHRVLNPTLQLERYDPDRVYVRRWIPELDTPGVDVHDAPYRRTARASHPEPILDHVEALSVATVAQR